MATVTRERQLSLDDLAAEFDPSLLRGHVAFGRPFASELDGAEPEGGRPAHHPSPLPLPEAH